MRDSQNQTQQNRTKEQKNTQTLTQIGTNCPTRKSADSKEKFDE